MKILVLNPPSLGSHYINRDLMGGLGVNVHRRERWAGSMMAFLKARGVRLPVMSLVYSATVMAEYHDVTVLDAANLELDIQQTLAAIQGVAPDWVISTTSISALVAEIEFVGRIRRETGAIVGLTGDAAASAPESLLERESIDFVVRGSEPEHVLGRIAAAGDHRGVRGVVHPGMDDNERETPEPVLALDELPVPRWDLFPISAYRYFPLLRKAPFVSVLSTRGCPYGCIYCPYTSNQGRTYRLRSVEHVLAELGEVTTRYGARSVLFRDPTFTLRRERTLELCDGMLRSGLDIAWACETRVDRLDEDLVDRMAAAGLCGVSIGVESLGRDVIRNAKRGWIEPDHIRRMVEYLDSCGIRVSGFFILGLPGDDLDSIRRTIDFAVEVPFAYADFKMATPFPGTPLFDMAMDRGWIDAVDLGNLTSYRPTMRIPGGPDPAELENLANQAYRRFYTRPRRVFKELRTRSFLAGLAGMLPPRGAGARPVS